MGKSARIKKARRQLRIRQETNMYLNNGDWLGLAKHFEKYGEQMLDEDMNPIKFESTQAHAEYLEKQFTQSAIANRGFVERLERGDFDEILTEADL